MRDEFLPMKVAAARIGTSEQLVRRRIRAGALAVYLNPLDGRERLVRVSDLEMLRIPRPIIEASAAGVTAA